MELTLKIHSVVDVITNSSTTVYVTAGQSTISSVTELINSILWLAESSLTAEELFEFSLCNENEEEYRMTKIRELNKKEYDILRTKRSENEKKGVERHWEIFEKEMNGLDQKYLKKYAEEKPDWWDDYHSGDDYENISLVVKAKSNYKNAKIAAGILSNLTGLFGLEGIYDG